MSLHNEATNFPPTQSQEIYLAQFGTTYWELNPTMGMVLMSQVEQVQTEHMRRLLGAVVAPAALQGHEDICAKLDSTIETFLARPQSPIQPNSEVAVEGVGLIATCNAAPIGSPTPAFDRYLVCSEDGERAVATFKTVANLTHLDIVAGDKVRDEWTLRRSFGLSIVLGDIVFCESDGQPIATAEWGILPLESNLTISKATRLESN